MKKIIILLFVSFFTLTACTEDVRDDTKFWGVARVEWGQYATPENTKLFFEDVTCDGKKDYLGGYLDLDNPEAPSYKILLVTKQGTYKNEFIYNQPDSYSLQSKEMPPRPPDFLVEHWEHDDVKQLERYNKLCPTAITVFDGITTPLRSFIDLPEKKKAEITMTTLRF
ncbi:MAG: hypothetical protein GC136_01720 [Alphaproteobacteria bacterium]|nr:hypothetical protein [Alphaproteobacteria bacterium]